MKKQIFIIHGGTTFKNRKDYLSYLENKKVSIDKKTSWALDYLDKKLGKDFDIIRPRMPLQEDAKYEDWKIYFERFIPYLKSGVVLIGNSLGGIFLAKYLSENKFPKKIAGVFLIAAPFDNTVIGGDLVGGFNLKSDLSLLEKSTKNLYLMFSEDDQTVPVSHAEKYKNKLNKANVIVYKSKNGHFKIDEFPEIVKIIKNI
jgi:predicted alpha/beta hydrolase family esterase